MALTSDSVLDESTGAPRLIGGRSRENGEIVFPFPEGEDGARYDRHLLKSEGTLWSFTIQRFPPKSPPYAGVTDPAQFTPFAVGYVELADEVIVESRLLTDDFEALDLGVRMELTTTSIARGDGGAPFRTFAFKPV